MDRIPFSSTDARRIAGLLALAFVCSAALSCLSTSGGGGSGAGAGGGGGGGGGAGGSPGSTRGLHVSESVYGILPDGEPAHVWTLTNGQGMKVRLTDYGATTISVEVPDRQGRIADVTLGYDTLAGWRGNTSYFGATVGRYANRIAAGRFTLDGRAYALATNNGENHLHGGDRGFDKRLWKGRSFRTDTEVGVELTYRSRDGEEGFPGNLDVTVRYSLTTGNLFGVTFTAVTDKPTVVNLAHHSYWNLAGAGGGDILGHELTLLADRYTPVDEGLIPTGELAPVRGTPMDFTTSRKIGSRIAQVKGGYDHNFVLRGRQGSVRFVARLYDPTTGRAMDILTNQPGIQFYTGNFLDGSVRGKGGVRYRKHGGLCLETQAFPDSPNRPGFPSVVLRPDETYRHVMLHRFSTR